MFGLPGGTEWVVIGVVALLLFGRRLPEVARSFGKSIVEFKRGLKDVKDDINGQDESNEPRPPQLERRSQESPARSVARTEERAEAAGESPSPPGSTTSSSSASN